MDVLIARCDIQKKRLHVEFDANMNPIGKEDDNFISYLGYLARSKVRIVYSHWKLVPPKAKELIWAQILQTFDVPNNKAMYKHWMGERTGRSLWRLGKILNFLKKLKPIERGRREISIPIACLEVLARPPRHQKWKAARMKGDKYINADVAEVASKIDALEEQSGRGFIHASYTDGHFVHGDWEARLP
ncbi:hypothetical protein K1719_028752 [Acacia pycnantha]|nr:hypothetical protein K1719_028752 [Acacia pycnantha]